MPARYSLMPTASSVEMCVQALEMEDSGASSDQERDLVSIPHHWFRFLCRAEQKRIRAKTTFAAVRKGLGRISGRLVRDTDRQTWAG